jgi:uncharacterized protein YgbK (DUF1537 family)
MDILLIGDDLTGCNAVGALFVQAGFSAVCALGENIDDKTKERSQVIVKNTNSRNVSPEFAYKNVQSALQISTLSTSIGKRIDSTLRGNIGCELQSISDWQSTNFSDLKTKFLVVSAYPDAGRTSVNGRQMVNGKPLSECNIEGTSGKEFKNSKISEILASQTTLSISEIHANQIEGEIADLAKLLAACDSEIIVCDSQTNADVEKIALAAAQSEKISDLRWIPVDPGPFSVSLFKSRRMPANHSPELIMGFVGSHTENSTEQIQFTKSNIGAKWIKIDTRSSKLEEVFAETTILVNQKQQYICYDFSQEDSPNLTSDSMATFSRSIIDQFKPAAIYASGGETAAAVLSGLEAQAFSIDFEIIPLAVSGKIIGGPYSGKPFATKGGLIGEKNATALSLKHLMQLINHLNSNNRKVINP